MAGKANRANRGRENRTQRATFELSNAVDRQSADGKIIQKLPKQLQAIRFGRDALHAGLRRKISAHLCFFAATGVTSIATGAGVGQLQYDLSQVAGDWKRMGGRLYLIYSGSKSADKAGVEVSISADGKEFQHISVDELGQPIAIPAGSAQLRFSLLDAGAALDGWQMIAVP